MNIMTLASLFMCENGIAPVKTYGPFTIRSLGMDKGVLLTSTTVMANDHTSVVIVARGVHSSGAFVMSSGDIQRHSSVVAGLKFSSSGIVLMSDTLKRPDGDTASVMNPDDCMTRERPKLVRLAS
jgi:hypothetical protein